MTTSGYFLFMQLKTYSNKRYRYVDSNLKVYHLTIGRKVCNGVSIPKSGGERRRVARVLHTPELPFCNDARWNL